MITNDTETFYKNMEIHDKRKIVKLEKEIEELKEQLDLYKQALLDIKEYINNLGGRELMRMSNLQICDVLEIVNKTLGSDNNE